MSASDVIVPPQLRKVLDALEVHGRNPKPSGSGYRARCPVPGHEDRNPSLTVHLSPKDQHVVIECKAGCAWEDILAALGLEKRDVYAPRERQVLPGCTLAQYAECKHLPVTFLQELGLHDAIYTSPKTGKKAPAVAIPYRSVEDKPLDTKYRTGLQKLDRYDPRFRWLEGAQARKWAYGLWKLSEAQTHHDYLVLVEGESDCHTLWYHGEPALGFPGSGTFHDLPEIDHFKTLYVVVEPDQGGKKVKQWLATSRHKTQVRVIELGGYKDVSGLHIDDASDGAFKQRWAEVLRNATAIT